MRESMRGIWNRLFSFSKAVSIVWAALVGLLILFPPLLRVDTFLDHLFGRYMEPIWSRGWDISWSNMIAEGVGITVIAVALIAIFQVLGRQPDDNDG